MREKDALTFRRGDAFVIAGVTLAALGLLAWFLLSFSGQTATTAQVYLDGRLIRELSLSEDGTAEIEGEYLNEITVRDGKIAVTRSTCPGEDCVHSGWISGPGRSIVCLPNRMEIRLTGGGAEPEVDAVVR